MPDEQKFTPEVEKQISEATSSQQIADIAAAQPRNEKGQFVSTAPVVKTEAEKKVEADATAAAAPTVFKDTVTIGGKQMEFEGKDASDILAQVKVATQAYEMGRAKEEPPKVETKKEGLTAEELAALTLRASTGDLKAMEEYMVKSGAIDRYLESKGVKVDQIKSVLETQATDHVKQEWSGAVTEFLANSDWPGGTQNEKLLKYKLAELKDEAGQPLAYAPSAKNLQTAYAALKEEGLLFKPEAATTEEKKTTGGASASSASTTASSGVTTGTATKKATGSTAFGTSQEQGTRKTATASAKVPEITPEMTPAEIMQAFKEQAAANGQSPDDVLRGAYSGRA